MEVLSRLSDKSTSSQEHSADKSDSSLTDEDETITKTRYARKTEIGARKLDLSDTASVSGKRFSGTPLFIFTREEHLTLS